MEAKFKDKYGDHFDLSVITSNIITIRTRVKNIYIDLKTAKAFRDELDKAIKNIEKKAINNG